MTKKGVTGLGQHAQAKHVLDTLQGGIVVALETWSAPQRRDPGFLVPMAQLAEQGGARALLIDSVPGFAAIRHAVAIPIIAADRNPDAADRVIYTVSIGRAQALLDAGAGIVLATATTSHRPGGDDLATIVGGIHAAGALAFGLIDTAADLAGSFEAGIDAVGTWQHHHSRKIDLPLLRWLVRHAAVPVFSGGTGWTPDDARAALAAGSAFAIVGDAITNPAAITARYVRAARRQG